MLLDVKNLKVDFATEDGSVSAVKGIDFSVAEGRTLGIVGESGSGKSQAMHAIMGLLASNGSASGTVTFAKQNLLTLKRKQLNRYRGNDIAMVFQDPMTSLNPFLTVQKQMVETLRLHQGLSRRAAMKRSVEMLEAVHIHDADQRIKMFPYEFSGGMRQRVMIAMALSCEPKLLICDEPTTALDVTVQAEILKLLREMKQKLGTSIIFITHDLGVAAGLCDDLLVMQNGQVVEQGSVDEIFYQPQQDYTRELIGAVPRLTDELAPRRPASEVLLDVDKLRVEFPLRGSRKPFVAVNDVSFQIQAGQTVGLVGESGSGKSTVARALMRLVKAQGGRILFEGRDITVASRSEFNAVREDVQVVFQDPLASLNPRMTAMQIIAEPLSIYSPELATDEVRQKVESIMARVGLEPSHLNRYPHEFSGGQCQRIGIARALISDPKLLICDEAVSALDVTIQAQIVELLRDLQDELNIAIFFIAHDLGVVRQMCDHVLVMCKGDIVEANETASLFDNPQHDYTRKLLSAVPVPDPRYERERQAQIDAQFQAAV